MLIILSTNYFIPLHRRIAVGQFLYILPSIIVFDSIFDEEQFLKLSFLIEHYLEHLRNQKISVFMDIIIYFNTSHS